MAPALTVLATVGLAGVLASGVAAYADELARDLLSWVAVGAVAVGVLAIGCGALAGRVADGSGGPGRAGPTVAMVTSARFSSLGLVVVDRSFAGDAGVHGPAVVTALVLLVVSVAFALLVRARRRAVARPEGEPRPVGGSTR